MAKISSFKNIEDEINKSFYMSTVEIYSTFVSKTARNNCSTHSKLDHVCPWTQHLGRMTVPITF